MPQVQYNGNEQDKKFPEVLFRGDRTMPETVMKITRTSALELMKWLGWNACDNWDNARIADKLTQVKEVYNEDEDGKPNTDSATETLINVMAAIEDEQTFEIIGDEDVSDEPEVDDDLEDDDDLDDVVDVDDLEDDDDDDVTDAIDDDDESAKEVKAEDAPVEQTEPEPEPDEPKKKRGRPKGKSQETKPKKEKKVGVIATIRKTLLKASEDSPASKEKILEVLTKAFPERKPESMSKTINVQVPNRLKKEGLDIQKNDNGYWVNA